MTFSVFLNEHRELRKPDSISRTFDNSVRFKGLKKTGFAICTVIKLISNPDLELDLRCVGFFYFWLVLICLICNIKLDRSVLICTHRRPVKICLKSTRIHQNLNRIGPAPPIPIYISEFTTLAELKKLHNYNFFNFDGQIIYQLL
jgi:hypothetical protein